MARIREETPRVSKAQRSFDPTKSRDVAPSARLTAEERARLPQISQKLLKDGIKAERWELEALTRGACMKFGNINIKFDIFKDWEEFYL